MNKVILVGNLTRNIELKYLQSNVAIAKTGIAVNRRTKSKSGETRDEVMFIDLVFWGRTAEIVNQYLKVGSKLLVEGRLQLDQWTDQNGMKRSKHSITVESIEFLGPKNNNNQQNNQNHNYNSQQNNNSYNNQPYNQNYNQQNNYNPYQQPSPIVETKQPKEPTVDVNDEIADTEIPF